MNSLWSQLCGAYATGFPHPAQCQGGDGGSWSALSVQIKATSAGKDAPAETRASSVK